jgi:hypothetical protein
LAEESAVDEEFATYLTRSNSVRKSLIVDRHGSDCGRGPGRGWCSSPTGGPPVWAGPHLPKLSPRAYVEAVHRGVRDAVQRRPPDPRLASEPAPSWTGGRGGTPCTVRWSTAPLTSVGMATGDSCALLVD